MFEYMNYLVAFGAAFALAAVACRSDQLEWKKHQGRFIIGNIIVACYALSALLHVWGRANVSWYSVFGVTAVCVMLINQAGEWKDGVPARMWRCAPPLRFPGFALRCQHVIGSVKVPRLVFQRYAMPHKAVDCIAILTLIVPLLLASMLYQKGRGPAIEIFSGAATPPAIEVGDPLVVRWEVRRIRDCPGEVRQFLLDGEGTHLMYLPPRSAGRAKPGPRGPSVVRIELPDLLPGDYTYRVNVRSECKDATYSEWAPDIAFSVVAFKGIPK